MRARIVLFLVIILTPIALLFGFMLVLGGGPKMFFPPNFYNLAMTVDLLLDGTQRSYVSKVICSVKDQRGSIAVSSWHIEAQFERPAFRRDNGGAAVVTGLDPCWWAEARPEPGVVYRAMARDAYDRQSKALKRSSFPVYARFVLIDDAGEPELIKSVPISTLDELEVDGVKLLGLKIEASDGDFTPSAPVVFPELEQRIGRFQIANGLPLMERRHEMALSSTYTVHASIYKIADDRICGSGRADTWIAVEGSDQCRAALIGPASFKVSDNFARIDIDPTNAVTDGVSRHIYAPHVVAAGVGHYASGTKLREASFVWEPEICLEGLCFETHEHMLWSKITLYNLKRRHMLEFSIVPDNVSSLLN